MPDKPKLVKFTSIAKSQADETAAYINLFFGAIYAEKFVLELERKLIHIASGLVSHRYFLKSKEIRYFSIKRKNYVLYKELKTLIQVISIVGAKQDMQKIKTNMKKKQGR